MIYKKLTSYSQQKRILGVFHNIVIELSKYNYMNKSILFIFFTFAMTNLNAQDWLTDFTIAKAESAKTGNDIVLVFSGSDWCVPCIKFDKQIWETVEFKKYAADHFVMLRADFPKRKKNALSKEQQEHNNKLAETYNKQGMFPLIVILDKTGKAKGKTGFKNVSSNEYIKHLESFK